MAENEAGTEPPATDADSRYYREGMSWENDVARRNRRSRSIAWTVATITSLIAAGAIGALLLALPLKSYEPYMVVVDKTTGFVEIKRPMAAGAIRPDESMVMFDVVRYVKARETYDPKALKDNYELAQMLSTGTASRDLTEIFSPANPANPIKALGSNASVAVTIKSVTFPNPTAALVRFSTAETTQSNTVTRHWVSLIRFRHTKSPETNSFRFANPLGFQVTEYRRDQESAPSAAAEPGT